MELSTDVHLAYKHFSLVYVGFPLGFTALRPQYGTAWRPRKTPVAAQPQATPLVELSLSRSFPSPETIRGGSAEEPTRRKEEW